MSLSKEIILEQMEVGPMGNFLYFIGDPQTKEVAVVDPAWDVNFLRKEAQRKGYTITHIFLTHGHMDHVNGIRDLQKTHDIPVYISKHEAEFYTPPCNHLHKVNNGQVLKIGNLSFECIHTPGHSPGCQCFRHGDVLIAGDTVFIDGCGRCDLPGSDVEAMYNSLYHVVMKLPDSTVLYPGHNYGPTPFATLVSQKKTNPYLTCQSREEFLQHRMGIFR